MKAFHAAVIAGGQGTRLGGVRKGDLRIGGVRQIDRVVNALSGAALPILVASGPQGQRTALPPDCLDVPDLESPCAGPLAGLVAVVARLAESGITDGVLVSAAVDTPFLPADFVTRMLAGLGDSSCAYACWGDNFYPPNAVWRIDALQDLLRLITGINRPASLKALQQGLRARRIDWADADAADPFANINTLADLAALQRKASRAQ